jgi:hypothetical protein
LKAALPQGYDEPAMDAESGGESNNDGRAPLWRAAILYVAVTVLLAYPLSIDPGGRLLSASPDTLLMMWMLMWDTHAITHQPFSIFDANIYYPQQDTLAYSENLIGSAGFAAPFLWLTASPVLAINIVALLSCVLCGVGTWLLARRVGVSRAGATLAGLVFAFSPPRFLRLGQIHLTTIQWIPFALAFLHAYFDGGRKAHLRIAIAFFTLQALTSGHGAVYLIVATAGLIAYRVLLGEPIAVFKRVRDFGFTGAVLLAPALLIILPYRRVQLDMGLRRWLVDWPSPFSSLLASPAHLHALVLSLFPGARINETASAYLFPGYIPLVLAGAAVILLRRRGAESTSPRSVLWPRAALVLEVVALATIVVAIYATAVGPIRLRIGESWRFTAREPWRAWLLVAVFAMTRVAIGRRAPFDVAARLTRAREAFRRWSGRSRQDPTIFYLLLTLLCVVLSLGTSGGLWALVYWLPGMNFIRIPSRFMLLAVLAIAVLAGIGFDRLTARLARGKALAVASFVGMLLVVEFAAMPLDTIVYPVEIPAIDRWLDGQPKPFAIAEVPLANPRNVGAYERRHTEYMLHSTAHWQKTVHGYSGLRPPLHFELYPQLAQFPDDTSINALLRLGVRYVVVHTDYYTPADRAAVEQRLERFEKSVKLEHVEGAGRVYSLVSK